MTPTDPDLILRCISGDDSSAFGELVRRHQSSVRGFLRHLTRGDSARSDDLAQETFIQAWRSLTRVRGGSRFGTWLFGIALNHFRNDQRGRKNDPVTGAPTELMAAPTLADFTELQQDLASALDRLPADERTALTLSLQFSLTHEEIAIITGWPLGTVKTHLSRGKERLRLMLASWNPYL